ncbi:uncharacterized protein TNCV_4943901 [Trichonephila clavipes]|nr:uncharacterized protein TNCV_4943901 [Trichonephila clavipes]
MTLTPLLLYRYVLTKVYTLPFARYCVGNIIKEELIGITSLLTTTKGTDICTAVRDSLAEKEIDLKKIVSVTTDGAPNMVGKQMVSFLYLKQPQDIRFLNATALFTNKPYVQRVV